MRRLAIAFFYNEDGIVDDYYLFYLKSLHKHVDTICLVSNGPLTKDSESIVSHVADDIIIRDNFGFDAHAYRAGLLKIGFECLGEFDEILLVNHTVYGPLFPFSELFSTMEARECDFWGITAHKQVTPNPFTKQGTLPFHINSYFLAVRRDMFMSRAFRHYWERMPQIDSYTSSIVTYEAEFTEYFKRLGYRCSVYLDPNKFGSDHPQTLTCMKCGALNLMANTGYAISTNNQRSDYYYLNAHLDLDVANAHRFYPLTELNYFVYTTNGQTRPAFGAEGRDLANIGSNSQGSNLLTWALGARWKVTESAQLGATFELPVLGNRDLFQYRFTVDLIIRF